MYLNQSQLKTAYITIQYMGFSTPLFTASLTLLCLPKSYPLQAEYTELEPQSNSESSF